MQVISYDRKKYNPLNDYMFKYVFGREEHKKITLSFLNAILGLEGEKKLTDIRFQDRDFDPSNVEGKPARLDIYGIVSDGSHINIEMQVVNLHNMERRTLYYWAKMYESDLKIGDEYEQLHRTITINILRFNLLPQEEPHSMYSIYNQATGHRLTDDLEIHFLEIPKAKQRNVKEMHRLERWLAYFSNKTNAKELEELAMSDAAIRDALQAESVFMQDAVERRKYEQREKALMDYYSGIKAWRRKGLEEGKAEGRAELVRSLLSAGTPLEYIRKATGWTEEQILKLK